MTVNRGGDATGLIQAILHSWGASITDADMTQLTFNSPGRGSRGLAHRGLRQRDVRRHAPGVLSWTDSSNNEAFLAGNIAYTSNAASIYAKAKADGNPIFEDIIVTDVPNGPANINQVGGGGSGQFYVPRGARATDQAKDLALHLLSPEVFLPISLVSAGLFLPCYADYLGMSEVQAAFEADPNLARMAEQQTGDYPGLSWPAPPNPFIDAVNAQAILTDMMAQTIANGLSAEEAVSQASDRMAQIGEEMGAFA
ncbi:MAG: extracellular solute-binding protein [Caldilineaceae bacterium]